MDSVAPGAGDALHAYVRGGGASFAVDTRVLVHADTLKQLGVATGAHVLVRQAGRTLFAGAAWPGFELPDACVSVPALLAAPAQLATGARVSLCLLYTSPSPRDRG